MNRIAMQGAAQKRAEMDLVIVKADGTRIQLGTISNRPLIRWFQRLLFSIRLNRYIRTLQQGDAP